MFDEKRFGETRSDGSVREPAVSVISGKPIEPGDVRISLTGPFFVRVKASEWRKMTVDEKAAMREHWNGSVPNLPPVDVPPVAETYEDMGMDDLKALAERRGVDLTGHKSSKAAIAAALRVADVNERFNAPTEGAEGSEAYNG